MPRTIEVLPDVVANQIAAVLEPLADAVGLRLTTIFGGVSQYRQDQALAAGVDIVSDTRDTSSTPYECNFPKLPAPQPPPGWLD